jgi:serpin B
MFMQIALLNVLLRTFASSVVPAIMALGLTSSVAQAATTSPAADFASAQADLAVALLAGALDKEESRNLVFSPLSAAAALGVTAIGASPKAGEAISKSLGLEADQAAAIRLLDAARQTLDVPAGPATLALRIIFDDGLMLNPEGAGRLDQHGIAHAVDRLETKEAVDAANRWVKDATAGAIPAILDAPPGDGFVALAALRFKGQWKTRFSTPTPETFHLPGKAPVLVPTMKLSSETGLFRASEHYAAVDLPYTQAGYSMIVITARDDKGLTRADLPKLTEWLAGKDFRQEEGEVSLPTFTLSDGGELTDTLDARGLAAVRRNPGAFPGFSQNGLAIARIIQKTVVSVDEAGTEAASATAVIAKRSLGNGGFIHVMPMHPSSSAFAMCGRASSWRPA